jgi:hypothetical protein
MTTTSPSQTNGTVTVRDADGKTRTIHRRTTDDGTPALTTGDGRAVRDLGGGRYEEEGTGVLYRAVCGAG